MTRDLDNLNKFQKIQINHILDENKEKDARQKPIRTYLAESYILHEIWEVGDFFQIAQVTRRKDRDKSKEVVYVTFIDYKPTGDMAMSIDQALLVCLSTKYESLHSPFVNYAERMLGMKTEVEYLKKANN
ncbi:hypothetical protein P8825_14900 [Shouchella clausii]|uniref:hypothetical protein n=1 Tax=Shouchella clausii TaxID=79880 RepID=UPI002DBC114A|nr:hypothetical protein [Shouchella clausii]MEB5480852.1 hypothetical protein [Shouchella clausii]